MKYLNAYESAYMERFWTLIDMKNFLLHHYPSLTVQEVDMSTEHEDGGITRSMISEVGDIGPVKPSLC